jgi:hypothetical protein
MIMIRPLQYDTELIPSWRIFRRWTHVDIYVGVVEAKTSKAALETAIERFQITHPEHQRRLIAQARE